MKIYRLDANADRYQCFIMGTGSLFEFSRQFRGHSIKNTWNPPTIIIDPDSVRSPKGDFPSLIASVPIFSRRAVTALRDILEENGELLPVTIVGEEYFVFNATRVVDAFDEENSNFHCYDDGRIFMIDHHSFFPRKLAGLIMFKIPQFRRDVYVTDTFVERVKTAGLKGFWFPLLWSDD